jgi:hypothetical protein
MTIRASGRSALIVAAALIAASAFGFAGTDASYAAANGAAQLNADTPATVAPANADSNAASTDQQAAPAAPSPFAGSTVAENTDAAAASSDATANAVAASSDDSSGWDKASIIGKIFIACGTLLTLGSAARMFMI